MYECECVCACVCVNASVVNVCECVSVCDGCECVCVSTCVARHSAGAVGAGQEATRARQAGGHSGQRLSAGAARGALQSPGGLGDGRGTASAAERPARTEEVATFA